MCKALQQVGPQGVAVGFNPSNMGSTRTPDANQQNSDDNVTDVVYEKAK